MTKIRWRWRLADRLGQLPFMCWADLVSWSERSHGYTLRGCAKGRACRAGSEVHKFGTCYCGKFQRTVTPAAPVEDGQQ